MRVTEVMTRAPACCTRETTLQDAAKLMLTNDCGCLPVVENDSARRVIGVVTDRDIAVRAVAAGRPPGQCAVGDIMTHPAALVPESATLEECVHEMERNQIRRAVVVNPMGQLVGMVAQADVARVAPPQQVSGLVHEVSKGMDIGHR